MRTTVLGVGMLVSGLALVIIGINQIGPSAEASADAAARTTNTELAPTTTLALATTTTPPTLPLATTTTLPPTTSTTSPPSTTTTVPAETVVGFIERFASAIAQGDAQFLFDRLHPVVLETFDEELCRSFIEREILALEGYRLTGDVTGPLRRTYDTPDGQYVVDQAYEADVSFTFSGQDFTATGSYAIDGRRVFWFAECR